MGGTPDFIALPGELSQEEVRTKHDEAVRECQYNSGHGGYTGTLAEKIDGVRAVDGGGLENARYVEDFTALLLNINRIYKAHSAVRIAGI